MSKRILFLYCTEKDKERLLLCEKVIRAALHKFRKSALFSYVQIDCSPSCRDAMRDILISETTRRDAIFIEADKNTISSCTSLIKEVFGTIATEHSSVGRSVFYPENDFCVKDDKSSITSTLVYSKEAIRKAMHLALDSAKKRKHSMTVCLQSSSVCDEFFLREAEYASAKEKHIFVENIFLDEMIMRCMRTIPDFDVVFTTKEYAPFIIAHLNSLPKIPTGYVISHCENLKIYRRQILPCEEINSFCMASSLLACAEFFENEFGMKNASAWLRRAVSASLESGYFNSSDTLADIIIKQINLPIRKRRTE